MTTAPDAQTCGGAFFADANGFATAVHANDSSPVTMQNPAHPGESIIVYADDFFSTWPPPPIGTPVDRPVRQNPDVSVDQPLLFAYLRSRIEQLL